jgi:hypothetical protein
VIFILKGEGRGYHYQYMENPEKRLAIDESDIEGLRQRLRRMSNPELLLFGVTTKCLCALETSPDQSPPGGVLLQLREAREEWKRRNPSLPLSESF